MELEDEPGPILLRFFIPYLHPELLIYSVEE